MPETKAVSVREVALLTIPQMGLMFCYMAMSMIDLWVAGQLNEGVLAALGFTSQILAFLMLLTAVVGSGCMAMVSQSLGAGKPLRARRYSGLIVGLSFTAGSVIALLGLAVLLALPMTDMVPQAIAPMVRTFAFAYAAQLPFYYSLVMLNSVFRAHKMVWLPTATLCLVTAIKFVSSVGLGLGWWGFPQLGYAAVAWTTFISSLAGFACNIILAVRVGVLRASSFAGWRWNRLAMPRLWRVGAPAALGNLAGHAGSIAILGCVSSLPLHAVDSIAAMTLGMRVLGFLLFPMAGLGMTLTILGGHLLGAGMGREGYALGMRYGLWAALALAVAGLGLCLLCQPVVMLFTQDTATAELAKMFLWISCLVLPVQGLSQMLSAVLAGAGATRFTCRVSCFTTWGVSVPLTYGLAHWLEFGAIGAYVGMACGGLVSSLWTLQIYMQKKWFGGIRVL